MSARQRAQQLSLLPPELLIDDSERARRGIRITLPKREPAPPLYAVVREGRRDYSVAAPDDPLRGLEYAVVDVETTGSSFGGGHRITEVCAVRLNGRGETVAEFHSLVNPDRPIPSIVSSLTHITWDMVKDAPRFWQIAPRLREVLDGAVFVAHNAPFDFGFISREMERASAGRLEGRTLCTVRLARKVVPEVTSRSLDALQYFFDVGNEARHRAFGDARATAVIFRRLLERLEEHEVQRWEELEKFLRKRAKRKKRRASPHSMDEA